MTTIAELYRQAPDGQLANSVKYLLNKWDQPPKAMQILELLDNCVYTGGASIFTMKALSLELDLALKREGITYEQVADAAGKSWRLYEPFVEENA